MPKGGVAQAKRVSLPGGRREAKRVSLPRGWREANGVCVPRKAETRGLRGFPKACASPTH